MTVLVEHGRSQAGMVLLKQCLRTPILIYKHEAERERY